MKSSAAFGNADGFAFPEVKQSLKRDASSEALLYW